VGKAHYFGYLDLIYMLIRLRRKPRSLLE
jgi:hypothetical protein